MKSNEPTKGEKILAEVKASIADNDAKMKACPLPHRFTIPIDRITKAAIAEPKLFCKWKCERCGAIADSEHKRWYELGVSHGNS